MSTYIKAAPIENSNILLIWQISQLVGSYERLFEVVGIFLHSVELSEVFDLP